MYALITWRWKTHGRCSSLSVVVLCLLIGISGSLFHHHISERDSDCCPFCAAAIERPAAHLALTLTAPLLHVIEHSIQLAAPQIEGFPTHSPLIPRGPPSTLSSNLAS
jgi:hypothetical protein